MYTEQRQATTAASSPMSSGSNEFASPFITYTPSGFKSVQTYTILKINIWYPLDITSNLISECQLCDLLRSVFSLRNNWDWYNLLQEQILNQHSQYKLYDGEGNKMINIPFIKHHGRIPFFPCLSWVITKEESSFLEKKTVHSTNSYLTKQHYDKSSLNKLTEDIWI